mmetsp:Transcript_46929/g.73453  ORF Transcript_46929/g.73453 Transcript_46929/m.73453 type:complete len:361 (-) Transcript_46929:1247-2329(-)
MASFCFKPCELFATGLGKSCGAFCRCVDKGCVCCCKACQAPCDYCHTFCCPSDKPSPIFLTFSVIVCGIGALTAVIGLGSGTSCNSPLAALLVLILVVNVMLIAFAFYLYREFSKGRKEGNSDPTKKAWNMFCYDPVVFFYLCTLAAAFVIAILGSVWGGAAKLTECSSVLMNASSAGVTLLWIYLMGGGFVICLSFCVECARQNEGQAIPGARPQGATHNNPVWDRRSLLDRLFFPRSDHVHTQGAAWPAGGQQPNQVPYAQNVPENIPYAQNVPDRTAAPQPPAYQPQAYQQQAPVQINTQQQQQEPPQQSGGEAVKAAGKKAATGLAQGLRMGANFLEKQLQKQPQQNPAQSNNPRA